MNSGEVNGYTMPLCLWNKDGATEEEKTFTDVFNEVVEFIKDYVIENKNDIEKYDLEKGDLKKFNPLYWKREKGKIVEGRGPTLYSKLLVSKKEKRIMTTFYDADTQEEIEDPMDLLKKYCWVDAAIKIESIFIGTKISLQVKLYEASVKLLSTGPKRLLRTERPVNKGVTFENENAVDDAESDGGETDEDGSIVSSESDEEVVTKTSPVKGKKRGKK